MKPLRISTIVQYIRKYAALYTLKMNANMSYYFLSQRYERFYVLFLKVENDLKHASPDDIHPTHFNHKIDNHLELRYSTPHFTAVVITLNLYHKLEWEQYTSL